MGVVEYKYLGPLGLRQYYMFLVCGTYRPTRGNLSSVSFSAAASAYSPVYIVCAFLQRNPPLRRLLSAESPFPLPPDYWILG